MKKLLTAAVLLGCGMVLFAQSPSAAKTAGSAPPEGLTALQTAFSLAKYGYANYSASALIGAAEIIAAVQTQALGATGERAGAAAGSAKTAHGEFTAPNLLADAKKYAAGDATLLAWADKVEKSLGTKTRGAVGGPKEGGDVVAAGSTITYKLPFRAGQDATIFVSGDGSTDLDLYILDENGNLIAYDEDYSDDCLVRWNPRWTGSFQIVVKNQGRTWNRFVIATN
jgi:hypothetical protein